MYELGLVLMGVLFGVGAYLGYDLHRMRERQKVLLETAETEERLRQIGGAVNVPKGLYGLYDTYSTHMQQASQAKPYNGYDTLPSTTGGPKYYV